MDFQRHSSKWSTAGGAIVLIVAAVTGSGLISAYLVGCSEGSALAKEYAGVVERINAVMEPPERTALENADLSGVDILTDEDLAAITQNMRGDEAIPPLVPEGSVGRGLLVLEAEEADYVLAAGQMSEVPIELRCPPDGYPELLITIRLSKEKVAMVVGAGSRTIYDYWYTFELVRCADGEVVNWAQSERNSIDDFPAGVYEEVLESAKSELGPEATK